MRLEKLENIDQIKNAQIGDIFPALNHMDYIDGKMDVMVEEIKGKEITLIGKHIVSGAYLRYNIKDIEKEMGVRTGMVGEGRFWFCAYTPSDTPNVEWDRVDKKDSIIKKYEKVTN